MERHHLVSVTLEVASQCGFYDHVVAAIYIVIYTGLNCPLSLRGPGSTSEVTMSKLNVCELSSGGGCSDDGRLESSKPIKDSSHMKCFILSSATFCQRLGSPSPGGRHCLGRVVDS